MRDTELQINLSNLSHNLNILKENTTSEIQGVLKIRYVDKDKQNQAKNDFENIEYFTKTFFDKLVGFKYHSNYIRYN